MWSTLRLQYANSHGLSALPHRLCHLGARATWRLIKRSRSMDPPVPLIQNCSWKCQLTSSQLQSPNAQNSSASAITPSNIRHDSWNEESEETREMRKLNHEAMTPISCRDVGPSSIQPRRWSRSSDWPSLHISERWRREASSSRHYGCDLS